MKEFIKKWMMIFGVVTIFSTIVPAIVNGNWTAAIFTFQLLFALLVICLLQLLTQKIPIQIPLVRYFVDLGMTLSVVLFFGRIWEWFAPGYIWTMFAMVIPAYIVGISLDMIKIKQDVDFINRQINLRREKLPEENTDDY